MSANLFELFLARAPRLDKLAFDAPDGMSLTYGELFERAGRAARALADLGVEPGDRVAVQIDKSPDMIVLALACLKAGAALLPLNTAYTLAELEYFLSDAGPALTICRPASLAALRDLAAKLGLKAVESLGVRRDGTFAERIAAASPDFATVPRAPDDLAAILYTSGTTGRSKGAMLTHENLASNASVLVDLWRFTADDVLIHALPVFHTHGLFVATNVALLAGATMIFQPRFDADAVIAALPRATSLMGVPTFYTRLLEHPGLTRAATAHMRLFVSGSAPLLGETHQRWRETTGHAILERYGMTETNMITSNPYEGERRAGTVGFPLPGVCLRIADPDAGAALAAGRGRRHRGQGTQRVQGLLAHAGEDRGRIPPRRLLHHRRSRHDRRRRLRAYRRPRQGPHHLRRLQRLSQGDRERDRRDIRRRRERGDRRRPSRFRRGRHRGRRCSRRARS